MRTETGRIRNQILQRYFRRCLLFMVTALLLTGCTDHQEQETNSSHESVDSITERELVRYSFESPHMGTLFRIILYAGNDSLAARASEAAFQRIEELNSIMSDYLEQSELNRLSATSGTGEAVALSPSLFHVLHRSVEISEQTGGAFDITVGPLALLWREKRQEPVPELPDDETLRQLTERVGYEHLILNPETGTAQLNRPHMQLDLGGIAKGYATQEALSVLNGFGITSALIDGGGDITLGDPPPGRDSWTVAVPTANRDGSAGYIELHLSNRTVATSGDLFQYVEIDGIRYSHIIDPRTGLGVTEQRQVTVIALNGMDADAYASAISVLGPEQGLELVRDREGVEVQIIYRRNGENHIRESDGFHRFRVPE